MNHFDIKQGVWDDRTAALIKIRVNSPWLKLGSLSNNYVSLLKYEATMNNLIDN